MIDPGVGLIAVLGLLFAYGQFYLKEWDNISPKRKPFAITLAVLLFIFAIVMSILVYSFTWQHTNN